MHNWDEVEETGTCTAEADFALVQRICTALSLPPPTRALFVREYWHDVFEAMLADYRAGATPNPDVLCNAAIKFDAFFHRARAAGAETVATGHYARRVRSGDAHGDLAARLRDPIAAERLRAAEPWALLSACVAGGSSPSPSASGAPSLPNPKCQAFFLAGLPQAVLQHVLFPLGALEKPAVVARAAAAGLHEVLARRESMGLCFVGRRNFPSFVRQYLTTTPGDVWLLSGSSAAWYTESNANNNRSTTVTTNSSNSSTAETQSAIHNTASHTHGPRLATAAQHLGRHDGAEVLTLGQGVRVPGLSERHYVAGKDMATAAVYAVPGRSHPALRAGHLLVGDLAWTQPLHVASALVSEGAGEGSGSSAVLPDVTVQVRHRGERIAATLVPLRAEADAYRAAGGVAAAAVAGLRTSPAVVGCVPGLDPRAQWAANIWSAWARWTAGAGSVAKQEAVNTPGTAAEPVANARAARSPHRDRGPVPSAHVATTTATGSTGTARDPTPLTQPQLASTAAGVVDSTGLVGGVAWVRCAAPHFAPAPGQTAVFYSGDVCLGRGRILAATWGQSHV